MKPHAEARQQVLKACLTLASRGFLAGTGGNVSLRVDERRFVVTPSGVDYYAMKPDDVCTVDIHSLHAEQGDREPSIEVGLHAALLGCRSDAAAVVHTHQPLASAVSLLGVDLAVEAPDAQRLLGLSIKAIPYAPSGTNLLVRALSHRLSHSVNAYLLCNHGLICSGSTLSQAIEIADQAEQVARRFLLGAIAHAASGDLALEALEAMQ